MHKSVKTPERPCRGGLLLHVKIQVAAVVARRFLHVKKKKRLAGNPSRLGREKKSNPVETSPALPSYLGIPPPNMPIMLSSMDGGRSRRLKYVMAMLSTSWWGRVQERTRQVKTRKTGERKLEYTADTKEPAGDHYQQPPAIPRLLSQVCRHPQTHIVPPGVARLSGRGNFGGTEHSLFAVYFQRPAGRQMKVCPYVQHDPS